MLLLLLLLPCGLALEREGQYAAVFREIPGTHLLQVLRGVAGRRVGDRSTLAVHWLGQGGHRSGAGYGRRRRGGEARLV